MTDPRAQLGPFDLHERIGEGGMGAVFRGTHRQTGVDVAVKVILRDAAPRAHALFRQEVQAHARLVHPHIAYLYEYGTVDADAERASAGELVEGSPYVAMELACGTVRDEMPFANWHIVHQILLQTLDGLAHSHARRLVHRDIKPENLLLFGSRASSRVKLADFGIAHAMEVIGEGESVPSGTPTYMAPEQSRSDWRELGPWTDLYALGCVAWELVCGVPPFVADSAFAVIMKHTNERRPALRPRFAIPSGLDDWVRRMMAIEPTERFECSADAARALFSLGPDGSQVDSTSEVPAPIVNPEDTDPWAATLEATLRATWGTTLDELGAATMPMKEHGALLTPTRPMEVPRAAIRAFDVTRPAVPEDWRIRRMEDPPLPLLGTGLGLFGLREIPFIGRESERDRIWRALRETSHDGGSRATLIVGDSGTGKSRLAEWMAVRADELGVATILRATHTSDTDRVSEGLGGMFRRAFRAWSMTRGEFYEYAVAKLPPLPGSEVSAAEDARALTELVYPTIDPADELDGPHYRFSNPRHKFALVARLLARMGQTRPMLVWLDDAQWGRDALGLTEYLLNLEDEELKVLLVLTLRRDVLGEEKALAERIEQIDACPRADRFELASLTDPEQRNLIQRTLPLEPQLTEQVVQRAEGNPLFTVQLLGERVERGELEVGEEGFRLAGGSSLQLPEDIHHLWMHRLQRMATDLTSVSEEAIWRALELAAALGRDVDADEWHAVCEECGVTDHEHRLVTEMVDRGLARRTDDGWTFAHAMMLDSIGLHSEGRWPDHHRHCIAILEQVYPDAPRRTAARRARHYIEANEPEAALEPLFEEVRRLVDRGEFLEAHEILLRRNEILEALIVPPTDSRRVENDVWLCRSNLWLGTSPDHVLAELTPILKRSEHLASAALRTETWLTAVQCHERGGNYVEARRAALAALKASEGAEDFEVRARAHAHLGSIEFLVGNINASRDHLRQACALAERADARFAELIARKNLGLVAATVGDTDVAHETLRQVMIDAREEGYRHIEAECLNGLGESMRFSGKADEAVEYYRRYGAISQEFGDRFNVSVALMNQAMTEVSAGRYDDALETLAEAVHRFRQMDAMAHERVVKLIRLAAAAGTGRWEEFDSILDEFDQPWPSTQRLERDYPWLLELAGDSSLEAGEVARARRAWRVASTLWKRLKNSDAVERLDQRLRRG